MLSDVRITTRYDEADFTQAVKTRCTRTGHVLCERGLPAEQRANRSARPRGMAAHESQSLIVEDAGLLARMRTWPGSGLELHATFGGHKTSHRPANLARLWRHVCARLHPCGCR